MEIGYLKPVMTSVQDCIPAFVDFIKQQNLEFDTIACRGVSGILPAGIVGFLLNKPISVIRKPGENNHSGLDVEGKHYASYVIIDDLIASGDTIRDTISRMKKRASDYGEAIPVCKGIFLYNDTGRKEFFQIGDESIRVFDLRSRVYDSNPALFKKIYLDCGYCQ